LLDTENSVEIDPTVKRKQEQEDRQIETAVRFIINVTPSSPWQLFISRTTKRHEWEERSSESVKAVIQRQIQ
jgi:hypothetical protein